MPRNLPPYATCPQCGEYRGAALRACGLCANCTNTEPQSNVGRCWVCRCDNVPLQAHHIAGKQYAAHTTRICINCHSVLSEQQRSSLRRHAVQAYVQGGVDLCVVWYERSSLRQKARLAAVLRNVATVAATLARLIGEDTNTKERV
jgi:hypothetical protein